MTTWLQKQRKGELQALAKHAGIAGSDNLLKDDLISTIDEHLRANSTQYSGDKLFSEFYERGGSPAKKPRASASSEAPEAERKPRRKTIAKEASSPEAPSTALIPRTPASLQRLASRVRLPASPAVGRAVQAQTSRVKGWYSSALKKTAIKKRLPQLRQDLSSVETINTLILMFEAWGLRRITLPFAVLKTVTVSSRANPISLGLPDIRILGTHDFWALSSLWLLTSFFVPLAAGYFINLTYTNPRPKSRRTAPLREIDPLTFNVVKALLVWAVYPPGSTVAERFGYNPTTVQLVNNYVHGGYVSMLIGAFVGILTGMHDTLSYKS